MTKTPILDGSSHSPTLPSSEKKASEDKKTDWCTGFPEYWLQWYLGRFYIPKMRKIYIGNCCEKHDENCSTKAFIKCLKKHNIVGRYSITLVASTACLFRYGKV